MRGLKRKATAETQHTTTSISPPRRVGEQCCRVGENCCNGMQKNAQRNIPKSCAATPYRAAPLASVLRAFCAFHQFFMGRSPCSIVSFKLATDLVFSGRCAEPPLPRSAARQGFEGIWVHFPQFVWAELRAPSCPSSWRRISGPVDAVCAIPARNDAQSTHQYLANQCSRTVFRFDRLHFACPFAPALMS